MGQAVMDQKLPRLPVLVFLLAPLLSGLSSAHAYSPDSSKFPQPHAITSWNEKTGYVTMPLELASVTRTEFSCAISDELFPTHPQQTIKEYHQFQWGRYNHAKLSGDDEACLVGTLFTGSNRRKACLSPDTAMHAVMSDTYEDACGNRYRGFWEVNYLKRNDTMGTLFSKGRAVYPRPNSEFPGDVELGGTYSLDAKEFLFFAPLFSEDSEKIEKLRSEAQIENVKLNPKTRLFETEKN